MAPIQKPIRTILWFIEQFYFKNTLFRGPRVHQSPNNRCSDCSPWKFSKFLVFGLFGVRAVRSKWGVRAVRTVRSERTVRPVRCSYCSDRMRCSVLFAVQTVQAVRSVRCSGYSSNFEIFFCSNSRTANTYSSVFGGPWNSGKKSIFHHLNFIFDVISNVFDVRK